LFTEASKVYDSLTQSHSGAFVASRNQGSVTRE
jgi:hypothetical protein